MAGANWPRYIAANVCYPAGKLASRTAGVGRLLPDARLGTGHSAGARLNGQTWPGSD